jgi:hypothetical protein
MGRRGSLAFALSWSWLVVGLAVAQVGAIEPEARVVALNSDQCDDVIARDELHPLIALELAPRTVRSAAHAQQSQVFTRAWVTCSDTEARLIVEDAVHGRRQQLTLDLSAIAGTARPRLVALSLSELIATVEMDAAPKPAVAAPPRDQPSSIGALETTARNHRAWLGAGIAREGRPAMRAASLQTGFTAAIARWPAALQGALLLQRGARAVSAGDVVAWNVSGAAAMGGQLTIAWVELTLGLGLRLGYARLHGDARGGSQVLGRTVSGLWWGPAAFVGAVLPSHTRWGVRCGLDLGYVVKDVRGLDGAGSGAYGVEGFQLHANLGVSLRLGKKRRMQG